MRSLIPLGFLTQSGCHVMTLSDSSKRSVSALVCFKANHCEAAAVTLARWMKLQIGLWVFFIAAFFFAKRSPDRNIGEVNPLHGLWWQLHCFDRQSAYSHIMPLSLQLPLLLPSSLSDFWFYINTFLMNVAICKYCYFVDVDLFFGSFSPLLLMLSRGRHKANCDLEYDITFELR